jgi:hypothetical protein
MRQRTGPAVPGDTVKGHQMDQQQLDQLVKAYHQHADPYREGNEPNARRLRMEDAIARQLVGHLYARGFHAVAVDDGEERHGLKPGQRTPANVLALANAVDEAHVYFRKVAEPGATTHWVFLVFGNDIDVITDYSYSDGDPDGFGEAMEAFDVHKVRG